MVSGDWRVHGGIPVWLACGHLYLPTNRYLPGIARQTQSSQLLQRVNPDRAGAFFYQESTGAGGLADIRFQYLLSRV